MIYIQNLFMATIIDRYTIYVILNKVKAEVE